ncbi:MAG TPA: hypothetical protein VMD92_18510, partial [Acidobacteriaceae bacterium]|nr:hypothetical protein [Acidobacteriaceae bacterium]
GAFCASAAAPHITNITVIAIGRRIMLRNLAERNETPLSAGVTRGVKRNHEAFSQRTFVPMQNHPWVEEESRSYGC